MRAPDFVSGLAEVTGIEETKVRSVDRALADAGFRQKGKGRAIPDITLSEAVLILISLCGSERLTEAHEIAREADKFSLGSHLYHKGEEIPDSFLMCAFGLRKKELSGMGLIEAVARVCVHLAKNPDPKRLLQIEIQVGGYASLQCEMDDIAVELNFTKVQDFKSLPFQGVDTIRRIYPNVLAWIGKVTSENA